MVPFIIQDSDTNQFVKQTMHIEPLFPIPIGITHIDKVLNKKILEFIKIKQLKFIKNAGGGGNSISSDLYILENDELSDIKKVLTDYVNEYFQEVVSPGKDKKLYITNSWINVSKNGDSHHAHKHPNSIVSAVLYVDTCEGDTFSFINEHNNMFGNLRFSPTNTRWTPPEWNVQVTTNTVVLFPSNLPHMVLPRPNICTGTRVSLSFNTWIKGVIGGGEGSPDQLHL